MSRTVPYRHHVSTPRATAASHESVNPPTRDPAWLHEAVEVCREAATLAARMLGEHHGPEQVSMKGPGDVVTDLDQRIEAAMREVIASHFPDHTVVGEELGTTRGDSHVCWWIDPIDGTTNFSCGLPWYASSIACQDDGMTVAGAVVDVPSATILLSNRDRLDLLSLDGRPRPAARTTPAGPFLVLTEWSVCRPWPGMTSWLARCADAGVTTRIMGSETLAITNVALGRCHGAVIGAHHGEDHAAGLLAARSAGAVVIGADGPVGESDCPTGPFLVALPQYVDRLASLLDW